MSVFRFLDQMSSRVQDMINSQWVRIVPYRDNINPNVARILDPDRPTIEVECILEYPSIEFGMELGVRKSYREANDLRNVSVGRQPDISIDRSWFANKDMEPRQGDRAIMMIRLSDGSFIPDPEYIPFEIMDNQRDGMARTVLRLTQLGSQT